jgi:hypothetical protein
VGATSVKISVYSEKEHVHHGGVIFMTLYWTGIRYTHKEEGRKFIWATDSYLANGVTMEYLQKDNKPAHSRLVVEGSWSLDLE